MRTRERFTGAAERLEADSVVSEAMAAAAGAARANMIAHDRIRGVHDRKCATDRGSAAPDTCIIIYSYEARRRRPDKLWYSCTITGNSMVLWYRLIDISSTHR